MFSVESRAISSFGTRSDMYATIVHLPQRLEGDLPDFLASCVGIPNECTTTYQQYLDLASLGPLPPGHNGKHRPNHEKVPTWLETQNAFIRQSLNVQLSLRRPAVVVDLDRKEITVQCLQRRNIAWHGLRYWLEEVSGSQYLQDRKIPKLSGELLAAYSMMLDELLLDPEDVESSERYFEETLKHYQLAFSHSPEIGSITLHELLKGGIRSACLLPLATGVWAGHTNLLSGDLLTGFEMVGAGGGMTICALSTLWVSDRIMRGIKSFGPTEGSQPIAPGDAPQAARP
ncbi:hypothetical protein [Ideonella alba]|uniref:Uncharacterized protein n=1 Tax=Ideonella alba TaxID=2824118 RepID=A0A941BH73_9BURK|nr:hypothetical protein [Ideonella alba]MBQ0932837.1 hypothetical protein [Ideonella alba]